MRWKQQYSFLPCFVDSVTVLTTVRTFSFSGTGIVRDWSGWTGTPEGPSDQSMQNVRTFRKKKTTKQTRRAITKTQNISYSLLSNIQWPVHVNKRWAVSLWSALGIPILNTSCPSLINRLHAKVAQSPPAKHGSLSLKQLSAATISYSEPKSLNKFSFLLQIILFTDP